MHYPFSALLPGLLIKPENVPSGIGKSGRYLRRVSAYGLRDLSAVASYLLNGISYAINHNVDQEPHLGHGVPAPSPRATYLADPVIKRRAPVATRPDAPAKDFPVKGRGSVDIDCRNFNITNFPVAQCGFTRNTHKGLLLALTIDAGSRLFWFLILVGIFVGGFRTGFRTEAAIAGASSG